MNNSLPSLTDIVAHLAVYTLLCDIVVHLAALLLLPLLYLVFLLAFHLEQSSRARLFWLEKDRASRYLTLPPLLHLAPSRARSCLEIPDAALDKMRAWWLLAVGYGRLGRLLKTLIDCLNTMMDYNGKMFISAKDLNRLQSIVSAS